MKFDNFIFEKASNFPISTFIGSIIVVCAKNEKIPFSNIKEMASLSEVYLSYKVKKNFNDLNSNEYISIPFPDKMLAKEIIFFFTDLNVSKSKYLALGSKISKLVASKNSVVVCDEKNLSLDFLTGLILPLYSFDKYKTAGTKKNFECSVLYQNLKNMTSLNSRVRAVCEGVFFARDLTNEPSNELNTEEFTKVLCSLEDMGVIVKVIEEQEMAKIGMNALLSVGKGSRNPSKFVILEWMGRPLSKKILGLVGKGVMFDSGGISLKPASGMQEMTGDMGGAAVIAGLFKTLALRKSKANVVGFLGLVENMPGGEAMKPGDIIQSFKGDTIEVNNTDAEGRLVLADLLWYCQKKYKVSGIIDLATLTGAVEVALGQEYCGLFSNSRKFKDDFIASCSKASEKVWELPLDDKFNSLLSSRVADLKNSGGRLAGATTAAMFLKRFIKQSTPWIHLDIAGVSFRKDKTNLSPPGSTGWGVRSLNFFVEKFYEK
ncbi:MAG: leucyl aminopeptidase [Paracoccaceae bacterium]